MKLGRTVVASLVGCCVVVVAMVVVGAISRTDADLCALGGAVIAGRDDTMGWLIGCASQVVVAVIAGLVYAFIFEWIVRRAGAIVGLAVAIPHAVIAGIGVGFLPVTGILEAGMSPPGAFLEYRGSLVIG